MGESAELLFTVDTGARCTEIPVCNTGNSREALLFGPPVLKRFSLLRYIIYSPLIL